MFAKNSPHVLKVVKRSRVAGEMGKVTGDFLIFVFLMSVKLSYAYRETGAFIRVDCQMCWMQSYFDNPVFRLWCKILTLNDLSQGEQWILFPTKLNVSQDKVTTLGHLQLHALITCNSSQHFAGNSEVCTVTEGFQHVLK